MKFYNYLNEENESIEEMVELIKKDCKPFLKYFKIDYDKNYYFHSGRGNLKINFTKKKIRKDRKPRDTPKELHNIFNDFFKEKFNIYLRSETFFSQLNYYDNIKMQRGFQYGTNYMVFPIGNFKIFYNPNIEDLYLNLSRWMEKEFYNINYWNIILDPNKYDKFPNEMEKINSYIKDIVSNYKIWNGEKNEGKKYLEYMIYCDEVYLINLTWFLLYQNKLDYFLAELFKE